MSLQGSSQIGVGALDARAGVGALAAPGTGATATWASGIMPGGTSGAGLPARCAVVAAGGMAITVNGGQYQINRAGQAVYLGAILSTVTGLTHGASNPSNPRIDLVVIRVRDPGVDGAGTSISAEARIIPGSPAAQPTEPTGQLTDGDLVLAAVTINANASSITSVSDRRVFVTARGGISVKSPSDTRPGSHEGSYRDNSTTKDLERWSGTEWVGVAGASPWKQYTPKLYSSSGQLNIGTGSSAVGRYQVTGKTMQLYVLFTGKRPMNLGYGAIYSYLPDGYYAATITHIYAELDTFFGPGSIWMGTCYIPPGTGELRPFFPIAANNCSISDYKARREVNGAAGTGTPAVAGDTNDFIYLLFSGTFEIQ